MVPQETPSSKEFKRTQTCRCFGVTRGPEQTTWWQRLAQQKHFAFIYVKFQVPATETFLKAPLFWCGFASLYQLGELFLPEVVTGPLTCGFPRKQAESAPDEDSRTSVSLAGSPSHSAPSLHSTVPRGYLGQAVPRTRKRGAVLLSEIIVRVPIIDESYYLISASSFCLFLFLIHLFYFKIFILRLCS